MILEDIAVLFEELRKQDKAKDIARHFGRDRKYVYSIVNGCNVVLNPEFIAGLNHYGYELKLMKKENKHGCKAEKGD